MSSRSPVSVKALTRILARVASDKIPELAGVRARRCDEADEEHRQSSRQYMHTNHRDLVICYAKETECLSSSFMAGLIAHELGHIALIMLGYTSSEEAEDHTEDQANVMGFWLTGLPVFWRGKKRLEWSPIPRWLREEMLRVKV